MIPATYRIAILQSCDLAYVPFLEVTSPVNSEYARAHGYDYRFEVGNLASKANTANFNRYYLLRRELESRACDWALWIDADALVRDHTVRLESIIDRTPSKLIIACRGALQGDHDINNGVFFFNLRHPRAVELIDSCTRYAERLPPRSQGFQDDQRVMQAWLHAQRDKSGRVDLVQCYQGREYNLFNYDGNFVAHVLREEGDYQRRLDVLRSFAAQTVPAVAKSRHSVFSLVSLRANGMTTFQREQRILVAAPAAYHQLPASCRWLIESCARFGIELTMLGRGQPYANHRMKVRLVADYLRQHPEYDYVLQVDVKDVVFCATLREIFYKYKSFGKEVVAAAERVSWPIPSHVERSPQTGTTFRYLNAGTIFSTRRAWLAAWDRMQSAEGELNGTPPEANGAGFHIFNSDQAAWGELYVNGEADIAVDDACQLFQALNQTQWFIGSANKDFGFEGGRIINRETGARPCVIHANANIPLDPWGRYVLDPSPVWIWPLIERLRTLPMSILRSSGAVEELLCELGLHHPIDGYVEEELLPFTGKGLCLWQRPSEFARYLTWLATRPPIRTYVEIGIEAGGSFITTIEYLRRFHPLHTAIGVDPWLSPAVNEYVSRTGGVHFVAGTQESERLRQLVEGVGQIDLMLIDGDHSHAAVRADWIYAQSIARLVAFHDIAAKNLHGVKSLWAEIKATHSKTTAFVERDVRPNLWAGLGVVELASSATRRPKIVR